MSRCGQIDKHSFYTLDSSGRLDDVKVHIQRPLRCDSTSRRAYLVLAIAEYEGQHLVLRHGFTDKFPEGIIC